MLLSPPRKAVTSVTYALISRSEDFMALAPEWNALLRTTQADGIFLTWEYVSTWWEIFAPHSQLSIVTGRTEDGTLVGIAPLVIRPGHGWRRAGFRHLTFLGGECESQAEQLDFIVTPGHEETFGRECWAHLQRQPTLPWDVLRFHYARGHSPALAAFCATAQDHGCSVKIKSHPTWNAPLAETWEAFLAQRSGKFREMTRKKLRKLEQKHTVNFRIADGNALPVDQALMGLIRLNQHRWRLSGSSFHTANFIEFHRRLAPRLAACGWLSLNLLEVDGALAAARYDFIYGGRVWGFQSGWTSKHADQSVGHLALAYTVQEAIARGLTTFDFQAGSASYKEQWAQPGESLSEIEITNPKSLRARFYGLVRQFLQNFR